MHVSEVIVLFLLLLTRKCAITLDTKRHIIENASKNLLSDTGWIYSSLDPIRNLCFSDEKNVSNTCMEDLRFFCNTLQAKESEDWALKMLDSSTKTPEGLLFGHLVHLGNFEECVSVRAVQSSSGATFDGKHCLLDFSWGNSTGQTPPEEVLGDKLTQVDGSKATLEVAWCIPSSCGPLDLIAAIEVAASASGQATNIQVAVAANKCHTYSKPPLDDIDIAALSILSFFILLAICSTAFDVISSREGSCPSTLTTFSVLSNWKKLISNTQVNSTLSCVRGIRVLSVGWIVLGNTLLHYSSKVPSINAFYINEYVQDLKRMGIVNTHVAIDSLLLTSGILVSFKFFQDLTKNMTFNYVEYYISRYIRRTPALAVMVLLSVSLLNHAGTGPLWDSRHDDIRRNCERNWWGTLLYVSNYVEPTNRCLDHSWYLSVDMQLYWLSPLVLVPLWKMPKYGKVWITILFMGGLAAPFSIVYIMNITADSIYISSEEEEMYMNRYYLPTHTRFTVWLLGIVLGYVLHKERQEKRGKLHWVIITSSWAIAWILLFLSVHLLYPFQRENYRYDALEAAFYLTMHRPIWALGVAWIVYACERECGGIINSILSSRIFQPLAHLAYGIYLTHMSVIHLFGGVARTPIYLSDLTTINSFLGVLIMAIAWAIPLTLLFGSPFIILHNLLMGIEEDEEDARLDLPTFFGPPLPFKMPSIVKRQAQMKQINYDAEDPDAIVDSRL